MDFFMTKRISVLVSGSGSNLQAVIDAVSFGNVSEAEVGLIISSNPEAFALERARLAGIKSVVIDKANYPSDEDRGKAILRELEDADTDLIVLAGYMKVIPKEVVRRYPHRIINIHPSLIPKHCGMGFYGLHVHRSVLATGDEVSGATVHYVDEGVDTGEIIIQREVPVLAGDTDESLAARVLEVEHQIIVEGVVKALESL
jgi:phosphoribosylglycinamide formyltransferase-1